MGQAAEGKSSARGHFLGVGDNGRDILASQNCRYGCGTVTSWTVPDRPSSICATWIASDHALISAEEHVQRVRCGRSAPEP